MHLTAAQATAIVASFDGARAQVSGFTVEALRSPLDIYGAVAVALLDADGRTVLSFVLTKEGEVG